MEQTDQVRITPPVTRTVAFDTSQANVWAPSAEYIQSRENRQSLVRIHACKVSQRGLQQATNDWRRANRDLGETAAFVAASLTTVTAVEAVISIAVEKLHLEQFPFQRAFEAYIIAFLLIFVLGLLRGLSAIHRRAQAEKEMDQARKGVFEFCAEDQWQKLEE